MPKRIFSRLGYYTVLAIGIIAALATISFPVFSQGGVDITIHYVEGLPTTSKTGFQVNAYLSVYDLSGNPIANLAKTDFRVTEDNIKMDVSSFEKASGVSSSLIVLVDNSDSMTGAKIENARMSLGKFVGQLGGNDRVAVYGFNDQPNQIIDFDLSKQESSGLLSQMNASPGTGTCLYDAVYTATQRAKSLPTGKRAVVMVTDGKDEKMDGSPCSAHTSGETALLASSGVTRIPLYIVGIGNDIDRQVLQNLAISTGGRFLYADNERLLDSLFSKLAKEFKAQYVLRYTTSSAPGMHKLAVVVNYSGGKAQNERGFTLQGVNTTLSIVTPTLDEEVSGVVKINGIDSGSISSEPYTFDWDSQNTPAGSQTITIIALAPDGSELARTSMTVLVGFPQVKISPTALSATATAPPAIGTSNTTLFVGAGVVVLLIFTLVVGAVMFIVLRRRSISTPKAVKVPEQNIETEQTNATRISSTPTRGALATLEVLFSDDPAMNGRVLEIIKPSVMIGRSLDCDFIFPQDTPISRIHVLIELRDSEFFLSEMVSQDAGGSSKRPKFGTFLNETSLEGPSVLKDGDIIRLGPRAKFRFEQIYSAAKSIEETIDLSIPADLLKTFDSTDMSSVEKTVEVDSAREGLARTIVSVPKSEQLEKTVENISELPPSPQVEAAPDPEKTLVNSDAPVPRLQKLDEMAPVSPLPSPSQELPQPISEKSPEEPGDKDDGKISDDIELLPSPENIPPEIDIAATPLPEDDGKTMEDIMIPSIPEDLEKTMEDIVIPPTLQPPSPLGAEKTLDDISFDESGKTLDDISAGSKNSPLGESGNTLDDGDISGGERTLDDIPPVGDRS
jgi:VWFA-related protein